MSERRETVCERCGMPPVAHYGANLSDGPHVSGAILICPTAIYMEKPAPLKAKPGHRYMRSFWPSSKEYAYGRYDGLLAYTPWQSNDGPFPLTSDWQEVEPNGE